MFILRLCMIIIIALMSSNRIVAQSVSSLTVEMRPYNGAPTIFIDGKPIFGAIVGSADGVKDEHLAMSPDAGLHLYSLFQVPAGGERESHPASWLDENTFDDTWNDAALQRIIDIDPEAKFTLRVGLYSPIWWDEQNMDEMIVFSDGVKRRRVRAARSTKETQGSWASDKWREAIGFALQRYIRRVEDKFGDRIVLYHLCGSFSYEWYWPGSVEGWLADYSVPNRDRFRQWLQTKYNTNTAMQKAWGNAEETFDSVEIPSHFQRTDGLTDSRMFGFRGNRPHWLWYWNPYIFRHTVSDQAVVDYTLYHSEVVAETVDYFAKIVREETAERKLVGASYGYSHLRGGDHAHLMGKNAQREMVRSPNIQFQVSPPLSTWSLTEPTRREGLSSSTMALHNQMHLLAIDHAMQGDRRSDFERLKKRFNLFFSNNGMAYMEVMKGRYPHEVELWPLLEKMNRIGTHSLEHPRGSVSDIAIIGDEESLAWINLDGMIKIGSPYENILTNASIIGAPYDFYLNEDIAHPDVPDYKLYIITDLFSLSDSEMSELALKVKRNGSTVLWMYAPGYLDDSGKASAERMSKLVGMQIAEESFLRDRYQRFSNQGIVGHSVAEHEGREELGNEYVTPAPASGSDVAYFVPSQLQQPLRITTGVGEQSALPGLPANIEFGSPERLGPRFHVTDPEAVSLGTFIEGGRTGFAMKQNDNWTSIYAGTTQVPSDILRAVAQQAGVHMFTDSDDVLYANQSYIAVQCRTEGGNKRFRLSRRGNVRELYSDTVVGENIQEFDYPMEPETCYLFYWGRESYAQ
jgi:hypothetical protein